MDHRAYIDATAALLGLNIPPSARTGVESYFQLAANMAQLVEGLPLTSADESATVFVPVAPHGDDT